LTASGRIDRARIATALVLLIVLGGAVAVWAAPLDDARGLLRQGKAEQARQTVAAYLQTHPGDREARFLLANILAQQGRLDAAYALFKELLDQAPDDPVGTAIRRLFAERGATAEDAVKIPRLFGQAQAAVKAKNWDAAIAALTEAVRLAPDNPAARNNLAQLLERVGRYEEAVPHLEKLVAMRPGDFGLEKRLALLYDRAGKTDQAITAYERLLSSHPKDVDILAGLGRLNMFVNKDYARATGYLERAVAVKPDVPDLQFLLGNSRKLAGDTQGAIAAYQEAVRLDNAYFKAHFELGKLYEAAGREADSLREFEATEQYGGNSPEGEQSRRRLALFGTTPGAARQVRAGLDRGVKALDAGDLAAAKTAFQEVLALVPGNVLAHYNLATVYTREGNNEGAIDELTEALKTDPTHFPSHYGLALIYVGLGRFEEAYDEYKEVVRYAPEGGPYRVQAEAKVAAVQAILAKYAGKQDARRAFVNGNKLASEGKFPDALAAYQKAIELDPDNPYYHYNAGIVYGEVGDFASAFKEFKKAVELKPDHVQSHFRLGLFYTVSNLPQKALEEFRQVIRYGTNEPEVAEARKRLESSLSAADRKEKALAYFVVGNAFYGARQNERALTAFRKSYTLVPGNLGVLRRMTQSLMQAGLDDEALTVATDGVERFPKDAEMHFYLGQIQAKTGDTETALATLKTAAELAPDNGEMYRVLAKNLAEAGRTEEAVALLRDFLAAHPDDQDVVLALGRMLLAEGRASEAGALYDWFLSSHPETAALLYERGLVALALGTSGEQAQPPPTATALAGLVTGAEGVAGTPRYRTATEWFERVIAVAGPDDARYVSAARAQISQAQRLRLNIAQEVIKYNTNANNSATSPKTGVSSSFTVSAAYLVFRTSRMYLPIRVISDHDLHYTFQTYVNTNTAVANLPTTLPYVQLIPELSGNYVRTQRGRSSRRLTVRGTVQGQLPFPRNATFDYQRTDFLSYTNPTNNHLEERLNARMGHGVTIGKSTRLSADVRYFHRVLDAVSLALDSDRTDLTGSLSINRTMAHQRSFNTSAFYTSSEDVRPANIRPGSLTNEVVPIVSHIIGGSASFNFQVYPNVTGTLLGSYSVTNFTEGVFQTFPGSGSSGPVVVETAQKQTSLSFGLRFVYRPDSSTSWVLDIRQVQARASTDVPANVEDILTNQVVQENINKRKTITLNMNYAF
jgi:tetratricopeptide (TPR) repeat protein